VNFGNWKHQGTELRKRKTKTLTHNEREHYRDINAQKEWLWVVFDSMVTTSSAIHVSKRRLKSAHNCLRDSETSNERSFNSLLLKCLKRKSLMKSSHHLLSCQMDFRWHSENSGHLSQMIILLIFATLMLRTASVGILPTMLKLKQRKLFYGSLMPILNWTADDLIPETRRITFYRTLKQSPRRRKAFKTIMRKWKHR